MRVKEEADAALKKANSAINPAFEALGLGLGEDGMDGESSAAITLDKDAMSELEASEVMSNRAAKLQGLGYYAKAQPLFEECFLIRRTHIPTLSLTGDSLFAIAKNFIFRLEWDLADEKLQVIKYMNMIR